LISDLNSRHQVRTFELPLAPQATDSVFANEHTSDGPGRRAPHREMVFLRDLDHCSPLEKHLIDQELAATLDEMMSDDSQEWVDDELIEFLRGTPADQ
jgi:hypothetical protein